MSSASMTKQTVSKNSQTASAAVRSHTNVHESATAGLQRATSNQAMQRMLRTGAVQAKLTVNTPGDKYEQEADRVADQVMRMTSAAAGDPPRIQRACTSCNRELESQTLQRMCAGCEEEELQRKEHSGAQDFAADVESQVQALQGGGKQLPPRVREFFEPRFGQNFSNVRVHTSGAAAESATSVNALAYTIRNHIVFAAGQYSPHTTAGRRLLAHELTHVVQQGTADAEVASNATSRAAQPAIARRSAGGPPSLQRMGDPAQAPAGMTCPIATTSPPSSVVTNVLFNINSQTLTPTAVADISAFIASWNAAGADDLVRVDGFASTDGPEPINWTLSCDRAVMVEGELMAPSSGAAGIPPSFIEMFAQGETNEFSSSLPPNRRATISADLSAPAPAPGPVCAAVPTATPATCSARHDAYCEAAKCFPSNPWLPCACRASGDVCDAVDAFSFSGNQGTALAACVFVEGAPPGPIVGKARYFLSTNRCLWGHWRAAFDAIHDPSRSVPSGLTAEWATAVTTCRSSGIASSACCQAHVTAEQKAIDHCGPYSSATFGPLPTDVPGSSRCSVIVLSAARLLGPPAPFEASDGDFGNVKDRIGYGNRRCCL